MAQAHVGLCSPQKLQTLQKIFDLIWMELPPNGFTDYTGPKDPDALCDEIARRVFHQFNSEDFTPDEAVQHVLSSFGVRTDGIRAQTVSTNGQGRLDRA